MRAAIYSRRPQSGAWSQRAFLKKAGWTFSGSTTIDCSGDPAPSLADLGKNAMRAALVRHALAGRLANMVLLDCTCGNGHDCLFLSKSLTGLPGGEKTLVLALDIQQAALDAAAVRCRACRPGPLFARCGHEKLEEALEQYAPERVPGLAVYNLGFLPGSDRSIVTRPESTLDSLQQAARLMPPGALLCIHAYAGHPGGEEECLAVRRWCRKLPPRLWRAAEYALCNKMRNPESLFLAWQIEKSGPEEALTPDF